MNFIKAKKTKADFQGFLELEREFSSHYDHLGVGKHYRRMNFDEEPKSNHKAEFNDYFKKENSFFVFAKEKEEHIGYVFGYIDKLHRSYKIQKIGYLDSVIVAKKHRGKKIGEQLMKEFFNWLRVKNITICQLHVKAENKEVIKLYNKLGFKIDELRLWKNIDDC